MTYQDRASLQRNEYSVFQERYFNPNSSFISRFVWGLVSLALVLSLLFLLALFAGALSWSSTIVVAVFLLVAFSLGRST